MKQSIVIHKIFKPTKQNNRKSNYQMYVWSQIWMRRREFMQCKPQIVDTVVVRTKPKKLRYLRSWRERNIAEGDILLKRSREKGQKRKKGKGTCMVVSDLWLQVIERWWADDDWESEGSKYQRVGEWREKTTQSLMKKYRSIKCRTGASVAFALLSLYLPYEPLSFFLKNWQVFS